MNLLFNHRKLVWYRQAEAKKSLVRKNICKLTFKAHKQIKIAKTAHSKSH